MNYKIYSGAGNDFVMINNWEGIVPSGKQQSFTAKICEENFPKIDGVIFLEKPAIAGGGAAIRMNYYNRDGSFGAMCGNGARCTAQFAIDEGILNEMKFSLEAVDKVYGAEITGIRRVRITFPDIVKYKTGLHVDTGDAEFDISTANWIYVGSEHIVVFVDDFTDPEISGVDEVDVQSFGSFLRYYKDFAPLGANVNFVESVDKSKIRIRTYERGVERETLACGTGIVSSAIISGIMRSGKPPITVNVQSGEELKVDFTRDGDVIKNVTLEGSAKKMSEGEIAMNNEQ